MSDENTPVDPERWHRDELRSGRRFAFGRNWARYSRLIDADRIGEAERSLVEMLGRPRLDGLRFLDAGCGSGLFSLAAVRLGATVTAFDVDPDSVRTTRRLLSEQAPDGGWTALHGNATDRDFLASLGTFDIVYSWGVLHHTGQMWDACDAIVAPLAEDGDLFIALYNDAGDKSIMWSRLKRTYVRLPAGLRALYAWGLIAIGEAKALGGDLAAGRPADWLRRWTGYASARGMSRYRDWIDWIGGYPYEYSSVEETLAFFSERGLVPVRVEPNTGTGCSQFVLRRGGR